QGDLANFKAQATVAQLSLDRAKQLAARQFGPQATVDSAQAAFDQAQAGIAKTQALIAQKLVRAPFDGELGVRKVEVGQYLTAGTQILTLTALSQLYANFTVTEKDSAQLKVGQTVRIAVDAYPGRSFEGKINAIEPQIATDTRNIRVQATIDNLDHILKPGMFTTVTEMPPDKPAGVAVNRHGLHRYFHQATGTVRGGQPADPSDRPAGRDRAADPAISQALEHGRECHDLLSRRV